MICSKCKINKNLYEFRKEKRNKSGFSGMCKSCANKLKRDKYQKKYYIKNIEKIKKHNKIWRKNNIYYNRMWRKNNIKLAKEIDKRKRKKRMSTIEGRLNNIIGSAVCISLRNNKNGRNWEKLVGYDRYELKKHLESLFESWMSWNNYGNKLGYWSIDHIIPKSYFHYNKPEEDGFKRCWALKNLRPLGHIENIKKGNKIIA